VRRLISDGCYPLSLTFDGARVNRSMVEQPGGSIDPDKLQSYFTHPDFPQHHIVFILDASHVLKLARNLLSLSEALNIPAVGVARWQHIVDLHELQSNEKMHLANKLSAAHVYYQNLKMKVKLAAQVLSASVAKALQFLRTGGYRGFSDTQATEAFLLVVDHLFDIMNSMSTKAPGYKRPLSAYDSSSTFKFFEEAEALLRGVALVDGNKVLHTARATCIVGMLINMRSLHDIFERLIKDGAEVNGGSLRLLGDI
jgi:hypothetical protein